MSFSKFTNMIDQKHSFLQLFTFLHPWTMCTRNLSPGSCFWSWKTTIITRFLVLFCFCFCFCLFLFCFCFFCFCFVLFCSVLFFNQDDDIQLQNKYKSPSPRRISYKYQFSGLVSSTQLFDLFTFSKLMEMAMKKWWRYNMSHQSPGKLNTDLSLTTKIKTANFVGPKTRRSVDRVMHLDVIGLLL